MHVVYHNNRVILAADRVDENQAVALEQDYPGMQIYTFPIALEDVYQQMIRPRRLMEEVEAIRAGVNPKPILDKAYGKYHSMVTAVAMAWYKFQAEFEYAERLPNDEFAAEITNWYKEIKIILASVCDENVDSYNRPLLVESQLWIERTIHAAAEFDLASRKVDLDYINEFPILPGSEQFVEWIAPRWTTACESRDASVKRQVWEEVTSYIKTNDQNGYDGVANLFLTEQRCIEQGVRNQFIYVEAYMNSIIGDGHIRQATPKQELIEGTDMLQVLIDGVLSAFSEANPDVDRGEAVDECIESIWEIYFNFLKDNNVDEDILIVLARADARWRYAFVDDLISSGNICRLRLKKYVGQLKNDQAVYDNMEKAMADAGNQEELFPTTNETVTEVELGNSDAPTAELPTVEWSMLYPVVKDPNTEDHSTAVFVPLADMPASAIMNDEGVLTQYTRPLAFDSTSGTSPVVLDAMCGVGTVPSVVDYLGIGILAVKMSAKSGHGFVRWNLSPIHGKETIYNALADSGQREICEELRFETDMFVMSSDSDVDVMLEKLGTDKVSLQFTVLANILVDPAQHVCSARVAKIQLTALHAHYGDGASKCIIGDPDALSGLFDLTPMGYFPSLM